MTHYQQMLIEFFTSPAKLPDWYDRDDVERYIHSPGHASGRVGNPVGPGLINNRLSCLSALYTYAASYTVTNEQGIIQPVLRVPAPTLGIRQVKRPRSYHALSNSEVSRFFAAIPRDSELGLKWYAIFLTYLFTARRSEEILALRYRDIERVTITENGQRREIYQYYFYGKGRKMIRDTAQLPDQAATAIFAYLEYSGRLSTIKAEDVIFACDTTYAGRGGYDPKRPLCPSTAWMAAKRFARIAGLDEDLVNIHMWRHVSARERYDQGEDIRSIQNLLRHQSLSTTDVYLRAMVTASDKGAVLLGTRFGNL